ncbi:MAG: phosphonate ABC transporter, permease protein PhnE [Rhodospirillales bacterium 70-18]|nr:MAG: phosphonate ABC transporter, permease protein PhnE [Rhodospirillales bacterium 70-18]
MPVGRLSSQLASADVGHLAAAYDRAMAARRARTMLAAIALVLAILLAGIAAEVRPAVLFTHIGNFGSYFDAILKLDSGARVWTSPADWFWNLATWLRLMAETVLIAYVGTLAGGAAAFVLSFVASRNLTRSAMLRGATKRLLEFSRTVPELVFALIFVVAFGLGPVPGVLAIAVHTMGTLGKLFAEVIENIDAKPLEGVAAAGGSWLHRVRFAALPQVLSNFASYGLLRFEINVRGAAVIGFVGAGGIGQTLLEAIRKFYYSDVSALLVLMILTVMMIDYGTEKLRHRMLGESAR